MVDIESGSYRGAQLVDNRIMMLLHQTSIRLALCPSGQVFEGLKGRGSMENKDSVADRSDGSRIALGSVYHDLLGWSASLPRWQQESFRRLLHRETLSPDDLDELSAVAVAETEQQASPYAALSVTDLPSIATREEPHTLVAIQNLCNVNVLREDQSLTFGPQLTVVYGDNASGKSGYGRVLKKVYRARVIDDILGDVRAEAAPTGVASATFVTKTPTGQERAFEWTDDGSPGLEPRQICCAGRRLLTNLRPWWFAECGACWYRPARPFRP